MKKIAYFTLVLICVVLTSCENGPADHEPNELKVHILKFEKPEYAAYATGYYNDDFKEYRVGGQRLSSDFGAYPYFYLGDDYYLVKWSWWNVYPLKQALTTPVLLFDKKWEDINARDYSPDSLQVQATDPAIEWYTISYNKLDKLFGTNIKKMFPEKFAHASNGVDDRTLTRRIYEWDANASSPFREEALFVYDSICNIYAEKVIEAFQSDKKTFLSQCTDAMAFYTEQRKLNMYYEK